jgi:hypothetical protein
LVDRLRDHRGELGERGRRDRQALEQSLRVETIQRHEAELGADLGGEPVGLGLEAAAEGHRARSP